MSDTTRGNKGNRSTDLVSCPPQVLRELPPRSIPPAIPMNQDLRPTPEINPHEPRNNLQPADSLIPDVSSLPVKLIVVAIMSFLIGMFVLGMPPSAGAFDYTRNIPVSEAVTASLTANWPSVLSRTAGMAFFSLFPLLVA